ncbi:efflux RND transporter permease subunit [Neptuniibacter caesariensis]|uniref:Predicted exporter, RND superfamily protein n=1 Tax=Neptuniibacter caesariensis TaxID=207954 RepID=A0A7U8GQ89_NEPCE|nr:MMPL family transporter [Neptuniibacter caesariensis]EAR60087.1 Predicted exporter, RND superfamily protein [Oceanospirillum sp. MED92] [Neptuniibacter caesariensis]
MKKISSILLWPILSSEKFAEGVLFGYRRIVLLAFLAATAFLAWQATQIRPDASFVKMIPSDHPYVANYIKYKDDLAGLGNSIRVVVAAKEGDIFSAEFQETLKKVTDELFYIPGVDRSALKSIWTPNVRWTEVTEEGFVGGPVIPAKYDGSEASLEQVRINILRSGQVGILVGNDFRSAMVQVPLFDKHPETGEKLNYQEFSQQLESLVRDKYSNDRIDIHITGFAKIVGDLIEGASEVALFFAVAFVVTMVLLYMYSGSVMGTLVPLMCSFIAVIWQLGLLNLLGYGLDPYSMLVPFLVFAIAVSHGVQIVNTITLESATTGADKVDAARHAFKTIYIPGLTALISDGIGFITLMVIEIQVIQDLAVAASVGVAVIVLTNLMILPLLMSYVGVGRNAIAKAKRSIEKTNSHWHLFSFFSKPFGATVAVTTALGLLVIGLYGSQGLQIGDLDKGAPELRADSRYNLDNNFVTENYSTSSDVFVVMVTTPEEYCSRFETLSLVDRFQFYLQNVPGVQSSISLVDVSERVTAGLNEGNLKWRSVLRNQYVINASLSYVPAGLMNSSCSLLPVIIFLDDHKAETLKAVTASVEAFAAENVSDEIQLHMAAGKAGFEAATNEVIETAQYEMLIWVYTVVSLLCLLTFRSIRTVICIIAPLALTSILCQALMAQFGIGVKVATLPVIALGVGIGVDYGIYIYSKMQTYLQQGHSLSVAYLETLQSTGKSVAFTGLTLAIGVVLWALSPIKFQADMGILLTFMFIWNMLGALILLPAIACLLHPENREVEKKVKA